MGSEGLIGLIHTSKVLDSMDLSSSRDGFINTGWNSPEIGICRGTPSGMPGSFDLLSGLVVPAFE